ncbi:MAG: DUF861 domain-containing protein [Myxococcus sp.]|nr:DUF861 domain-containing protein [Myxococcus sp.]
MKRLVTAEVVSADFAKGHTTLFAPRGQVIVTPAAWTRAHELGVTIDQSSTPPPTAPTGTGPTTVERVVGAGGLVLVRGATVELSTFAGAGPGKHVQLADVITSRDGSPMAAGFMSWSRDDSFDWQLDYDEVDLVLEGVLQLTLDGQTLEGRPGDVFFIPKGSKVRFGTPWRTRVYYVTYPADWAAPRAT